MKYQVLGKVSPLILLIAYLNPNDTFYINTNKEETEKYSLGSTLNGKQYVLDNIIIEYPVRHHSEGILVDLHELSANDIDHINEYLEKDEPAWLSDLYCAELQQLNEYAPFLGNKQCNIPTKNLVSNPDVNLVDIHATAVYFEFVDKILTEEKDSKIIFIGNWQHFVHNDRILVYNPVYDKEIDQKNIDLLIHSAKKVYITMDTLNELDEISVNHKIKNAIYWSELLYSSEFNRSGVDCIDYYESFKQYPMIYTKFKKQVGTFWLGQPCYFFGNDSKYQNWLNPLLIDSLRETKEYTEALSKVDNVNVSFKEFEKNINLMEQQFMNNKVIFKKLYPGITIV